MDSIECDASSDRREKRQDADTYEQAVKKVGCSVMMDLLTDVISHVRTSPI